MISKAEMREANSMLHRALLLGLLFALLKLTIQVSATLVSEHAGYGYFRDELYYLQCGRMLDWGYVDHGPLVALQARLALILFGRSILAIRMISAFAGAAKILLTGLLTWALGGKRPAQALAMTAVVIAPLYLGLDSYLSMNSFEPVFWMGAMLTIILIERGASCRWWLLVGAFAGLGLENKPSMLFYLIALIAALLLTSQRRSLASWWFAAAVALTLTLATPNLLWQIHHHWPTLEFLRSQAASNKDNLRPLPFLLQQVRMLSLLNAFVWMPGLVWLLRRTREMRSIALCYLLLLAIMLALRSKAYYLAPMYPVLFAAGGVWWQGTRHGGRNMSIVGAILLVTGALLLPMSLPLLPPAKWIHYTETLHIAGNSTQRQREYGGQLPQFFADRLGWQELTAEVARAYNSLSPQERVRVGILTDNYGEASALNFLGAPSRLPFAISGHNNYFLWGPHGYTGDVMILVTSASRADLQQSYNSVKLAGHTGDPYTSAYETRNIYVVRGRKTSLVQDWANLKHFD